MRTAIDWGGQSQVSVAFPLYYLMSRNITLIKLISLLLCSLNVSGQKKTIIQTGVQDTSGLKNNAYFRSQKDLIDIAYLILHKDPLKRLDSVEGGSTRLRLSVSPIIEYTQSTGFTAGIAMGGAFFTSVKQKTNISSFLGAIKYTQKNQFLLPVQSSIWTPGNKYNFPGDWRFLHFPQNTYGIGGKGTAADKNQVTYKLIRFYEYALKHFSRNLYGGIGYQLNYHWGIQQLGVSPGRTTDYKIYGFANSSVSSGLTLDLLYDSRTNSINPEGGTEYINIQFLQNEKILGSSNNWSSVFVDLRKYFKLSKQKVLAFWFYSVITLSGNPPYLDLPGTGNDSYNNTGRGYEQGRFIGKKFAEFETELRFGITKNGLIGGVLFSSAGCVSELKTNRFESVFTAIGAGLRIKLNKFSKTNNCIDYGTGSKHSRGFSGNLGEVF
jgi:hypothetical protein